MVGGLHHSKEKSKCPFNESKSLCGIYTPAKDLRKIFSKKKNIRKLQTMLIIRKAPLPFLCYSLKATNETSLH
jgi:hypothetical protein